MSKTGTKIFIGVWALLVVLWVFNLVTDIGAGKGWWIAIDVVFLVYSAVFLTFDIRHLRRIKRSEARLVSAYKREAEYKLQSWK